MDASQQRYPTWQAALDAYTNSYNLNKVCAVPEPNTHFWTKPICVRSAQPFANSSTAPEEELWAAFADEDAAARDQLANGLRSLTL